MKKFELRQIIKEEISKVLNKIKAEINIYKLPSSLDHNETITKIDKIAKKYNGSYIGANDDFVAYWLFYSFPSNEYFQEFEKEIQSNFNNKLEIKIKNNLSESQNEKQEWLKSFKIKRQQDKIELKKLGIQ